MKKILVIFLTIILGALSSCRKSDSYINIHKPGIRTVLVYMIAENSLNNESYFNVDKMVQGATALGDSRINYVVYLDPSDGDKSINNEGGSVPRLINVTVDSRGRVKRDILKWYPEQNSSSPLIMRSVIDDVCTRFPSQEYGLMLWSHGMGWLPATYRPMSGRFNSAQFPLGSIREIDYNGTRSFGQDGVNWMEIDDLVEAIPDNRFKFIIFDACYMGAVEVAYALRSKCEYLISSPTEILGEGFPYDKIIPHMFGDILDLEGVCRAFYDHYSQSVSMNYATISLLKTSEFEPMREIIAEIISTNRSKTWNVDFSKIQKFNRFNGYVFLDIDDVISQIATPEQLVRFKAQMNSLILYKNFTPWMLNLAINRCSGLSMYVPQTQSVDVERFYKTLEWYKAVWEESE